MKFGIMFANTGPFAEAEGAVALAQAAEHAGFESLWTVEHVVVPKGYQSAYPYDESGKMPGGREDFDIPDPLIWLSYVAAATKSIKLGTGILILPQRNPVVTAKEVATLDKLSGGRVMLGIGVGWLEEEFDALGVPFAKRGARTDDYVRALRALWTEDCPSYEGEFVSFGPLYSRPQPAQGSVPIVVGGHSRRAAQRAGELGDGFFPGSNTADGLADLVAIARNAASAAGRDPDALEITAFGGPPEHVQKLADMGVARVLVPPMPPDQLAAFGENVIANFS
jgi:probable F420-dependent oxidoreductase